MLTTSRPKEPNFLALGVAEPQYAGPGDSWNASSLVSDEAEWRRLFESPDGVLAGEASVTTLYYPAISIGRIRQFCPRARLVAVLRAPWDRSRSAWMLLRGQGRESLGFADALAAESDRIRNGYESIWHYRSQSLYARQIGRFREAFGERLLVVEYERMIADASEIHRVHAHLGVAPTPVPVLGRVNASTDPRFARLRGPMDRLHAHAALRSTARAVLPPRVRRAILGGLASAAVEPFPPGFVESFDDDLAELRSILGDQAPRWAAER